MLSESSSEWLPLADQDLNVNRLVGGDWFGASNYDGPRLMRPGGFSEIDVAERQLFVMLLGC